jgi:hypothetical protein
MSPGKDLFDQEEPVIPPRLVSHASFSETLPFQTPRQAAHRATSHPSRRTRRPKQARFSEPEKPTEEKQEKQEFKPFSAQSVIHSLFRESKLSKRTEDMDAPTIQPDELLSPALNDPLMNPEPSADLEAAETVAPTTKKKIRWSKYIPWVWTFCMCFILFGFLPWGAYTLNQEGSETYVQVRARVRYYLPALHCD